MIEPHTGFKRMVVGLPQSPANQAAVAVTLDFAEFLNVELQANFIADHALSAVAGLALARELRIFDRGWHAIDVEQIARDTDRAAAIARRGFADAAKRRAVTTSFAVVGGAEAAAQIRADDIVAIIEPSHPGETIAWQFTGLVAAASRLAGALLLVPRRLARATGPIMALAVEPEDSSIPIAIHIAAALGESLILVVPPGADLQAAALAEAKQRGVRLQQVTAASTSDIRGLALAHMLPGMGERVRVMARTAVPDDAQRLFPILHGVPMLVIVPHRAIDARPN